MIKVNYNAETGRVYAFGKDIEPYIEITEEERRQPLPNKYSWSAVVDNKFTIQQREPTAEEKAHDEEEARKKAEYKSPQQRIAELESALEALLEGRTE